MKVGITTFGCDLKSGMSRYISNLIAEFSKIANDDYFNVIAHRSAAHEYLEGVKDGHVEPLYIGEWLSNPLLNVAWHQVVLPRLASRQDFAALFVPAASRRTPIWAPCPTIGTVHDLSSFHIMGKYDQARTIYQERVLPAMLKRLTHIIAISESTKRDIQEYVGVPDERITVIHHAADTNAFFPKNKDDAAKAVQGYGVRQPYAIYTSRIESPAKNHLRLIQAFEKLKTEAKIPHQLVLAGADWHGADEVHQAAESSRFAADILLTGFVRGKDLPDLYRGADMLVFPSLFEVFGFPILEAMACGVPVACSNVSSMPEVAGGATVLFDPLDVDSIAEGMLSILSSEDEAVEIGARGLERSREFSWEKTARLTLETIRKVAEA